LAGFRDANDKEPKAADLQDFQLFYEVGGTEHCANHVTAPPLRV
jgi:hypothetical protein